MNRNQERVLTGVVIVLTVLSFFYGDDRGDTFYRAVVPILLLAGLMLFRLRARLPQSRPPQASDSILSQFDDSLLASLERAARLQREGVLTESEFAEIKQRLLSGSKPVP